MADPLKSRGAWLLLAGVPATFLLVVFALVRQPLERARARTVGEKLGGSVERVGSDPDGLYWTLVEDHFDERFARIASITLEDGKRGGESLSFLRSIPELEELDVPFQDASDAVLADCVRNMETISELDLSGTFAGEKTAKAILAHKRLGARSIILNHCPIPEALASEIKAKYLAADVYWLPALPESERRRFQALGPAVDLTKYDTDWSGDSDLWIDLAGLTPEQIPILASVTGSFDAVRVYRETITPEIAQAITRDKTIHHLALNHSTLPDPMWLRRLEGLQYLDLQSCTIHLPGPETGTILPDSVKRLWIPTEHQFVGPGGLGRFVAGSSLEEIKGRGDLRDDDLAGYGLVTQLKFLSLDHQPHLTDRGIQELSNLHRLEEFFLSGATNLTDRSMRVLSGMTNLVELYISDTPFTDRGLVALKPLTKLARLRLETTGITDKGLIETLPNFPALTRLDLEGTRVTDALLPTLAQLPNLKILGILDTDITDVDGLLALPKLERLICSRKSFDPAEFKRLEAERPDLKFTWP